MKRPAFQFYPADWRKDTALQGCSLIARGLWHEMLCLMHECEPYGYLSVNGKPMKPAQVARLVGISEKEYQRVLAELIDAGVPSIAEDGSVYSRRMVRDEQVREARAAGGKAGSEHGIKGAEHGKKGGRPKKGKGGLETPLPVSEIPPPSSSSSSSTTENTSVPDGTDAEASNDEPAGIDAKDALWQIAVPWMVERQVKEGNARSLLGAAVKVLGDAGAWALCQRMMGERPMEPAAWMAAALNAQTKIAAVAGKKQGVDRHGNFGSQDYRAGVTEDGTF